VAHVTGFDAPSLATMYVDKPMRSYLPALVKRILRKYGYPLDKQEKATQLVLELAELLSREWAVA
jgi:type I restriction enzyme R subunit